MHLVADKLKPGTVLDADICIIGAGPAGITLARALEAGGGRILLIEAGTLSGGRKAHSLYEGETADDDLHQVPSTDRARGLGGSSALWGGRCMPYDPQDFAARDHIDKSGWPFGLEELAPHYRAAQAACEAGDWAYDTESAGLPGEMIEGAQTDALRLDTLERWSPPTHFGKVHRRALVSSRTITVLTGAVATKLESQGRRVETVTLSTLSGRPLSVRAGRIVLAGGGLEVPRLLMHSHGADGRALGDGSGWLGRGYMSHLGGVLARIVISGGRRVVFGYEQDEAGIYVRRRLTLSAETQEEHGLPNFYALLDRPLVEDADHGSAVLSLAHLVKLVTQRQHASKGGTLALYSKHLRNLVTGAPEVLTVLPRFGRRRFLSGRRIPSLLLGAGGDSFYLFVHAEQTPDPRSRITLAESRDAVGMRRLRMEPVVNERDLDGIMRLHDVIGAELERTGAGRLEFLDKEPEARRVRLKCTLGHHIGGARMAADPDDGVVDPDGRVHGTENLYVASAAMLPTSSQAHPTLTVVALADRLAAHLLLTPGHSPANSAEAVLT